MERLFCIGIGFVIAVVLIVVFFGVKDSVEDAAQRRRKLNEIRMKEIARNECRDIAKALCWYNIVDFDERVNEPIDSRLAEKEGEYEAAEL